VAISSHDSLVLVAALALDVDAVRARFPALGHGWALFDGPGGTQVPDSVIEAVAGYLRESNANLGGSFEASVRSDALVAEARLAGAGFLGCAPEEIVFGQNMTTLTFHLGRALGRQFQSGDEIVVTELDHHANSDTWRALAQDRDLTIRVLPMDVETGQLELDRLPSLLNEKTRLVAIGAASNILGTINDFEKVCTMARDAGALSFVDAVHYAAHELIDVKNIGCDFLGLSAYKFYGPHIGILYGRKELLESIDAPKLKPAPDYSPERLETGTQNHEGIAGAAAGVEFLASLASDGSRRERLTAAFDALHRRQHEMFKVMWDGLSSISGVTVYGPPPEAKRTSTVSFSVEGHKSESVARKLADEGLFLSDGDFYASTVVEKIGVGSLVRAGLACYTTIEEVDRLVDALRSIAANPGK